MDVSPNRAPAGMAIGLCSSCAHARRIESDRGSQFILCEISSTNPSFAKYPRLPVLNCSGYKRASSTAD